MPLYHCKHFSDAQVWDMFLNMTVNYSSASMIGEISINDKHAEYGLGFKKCLPECLMR